MSTPTTWKPAREYPTPAPPAPQNRSSSRGFIAPPPRRCRWRTGRPRRARRPPAPAPRASSGGGRRMRGSRRSLGLRRGGGAEGGEVVEHLAGLGLRHLLGAGDLAVDDERDLLDPLLLR